MFGRKRSLGGPVAIFVIVLALTVTLTVLWNVVLVHDYSRIRDLAQESEKAGEAFHWTFIAVGSSLFVAILVLTSIFGARLFSEIRLSRLQDNFLASISHELNSPLQSIQLYVQTLLRPGVGEADRQRFLAIILEDVARLGSLIGNVLRAAQIDQRRLALVRERIALRDFLRAFVDRTAAAFARAGTGEGAEGEDGAEAGKGERKGRKTGRIALAPGPEVWVEADRLLLRQMLDNLVSNSVKYAKDAGVSIEVSLSGPRGNRMVLAVKDDGVGIPRSELRRVFERFYRVENTDPDRSRSGTGLGLAIVRSLAESHGWQVSASSAGPGTGTAIEFEIPEFELVGPGVDTESGEEGAR
ncbi:MAG: HAMP domain-containing histidine kinase [Planctomycetes bacterium]|nr:HAMP domain-containing histidine kinase [Planctomycetota bacterium]